MLSPPSLPLSVSERTFRASNGELGVMLSDVNAFIDACRVDGITELGWEIWLIDHQPDPFSNSLLQAPGGWSGLFPLLDDPRLGVMGGQGTLAEVRQEIGNLDSLLARIPEQLFAFVRINFTIL